MPRKNNTLHLHSKLALEIKAAKKTMFKRHREGLPLRMAADQFCIDIASRLNAVVPDHSDSARRVKGPIGPAYNCTQPEKEGVTPIGVKGPPMGTTDGKCISQSNETEVFDELQEQAMRAIMALLNARGIPTCIKRGLADSLEETAKLAGLNERTIWTSQPGPAALTVNSKVLWEVFETPAVRDMWDLPEPSNVVNEDVLRAISELLGNPNTPQGLYEAITGFVDDQASSEGNILLREPVLSEVLKTVKPEDTHGAVCARVAAEFGGDREVSHEASN